MFKTPRDLKYIPRWVLIRSLEPQSPSYLTNDMYQCLLSIEGRSIAKYELIVQLHAYLEMVWLEVQWRPCHHWSGSWFEKSGCNVRVKWSDNYTGYFLDWTLAALYLFIAQSLPSSVLDVMIQQNRGFQLNIRMEISSGFKIFQESVRIFYTEYFLKYLDQVLIIGILFSTIKIVSQLLFKWKI